MTHRVCLALCLVVGASPLFVARAPAAAGARAAANIHFVFTSDAHYGLTRPAFRGRAGVNASDVNRALVASVNTLSGVRFPEDGGVDAGRPVGAIDFLVEGGDITNRQEADDVPPVQPASSSWAEFVHDYVDELRTVDRAGLPSTVLVVPGNHDASNAVGFYKPMQPPVDSAPMVSIYNRMRRPTELLTAAMFDYARDRLFFSRDAGGVRLQFVQIWPDSVMREQMAYDLEEVPSETPVVVFTHDQPDVEAKHFINPNGAHDINPFDRFENLLADRFADGPSIDLPSTSEQRQLEAFLDQHRNIVAYFHGNSNWHQAYEWNGPGRTARLHVFRVDSPMKGAVSSRDERQLSYQVVTIDPVQRTLTVRECLWNVDAAATRTVTWGDSVTVSLRPQPRAPVRERPH